MELLTLGSKMKNLSIAHKFWVNLSLNLDYISRRNNNIEVEIAYLTVQRFS
jgi:hypothetical protein